MLAEKLSGYAGKPDVVVLGLPRGGVPVAYEVARALRAPLREPERSRRSASATLASWLLRSAAAGVAHGIQGCR